MSATLSQYLKLITSEHAGQPNFVASVTASISVLIDVQNFLPTVQAAYDFDNAVGAQLDVLGQWIGQSRDIETPLPDVYFSWDTPLLGWDQGAWMGPYDPLEGLTVLADPDYKLLLKAVIGSNNWDGTVIGAAAALANLFNGSETPGTNLIIEDLCDMHMNFVLTGQPPSAVFQGLLANGYLRFRPGGVAASYQIVSDPGPAFGFDLDNQYIQGWDEGNWTTLIGV